MIDYQKNRRESASTRRLATVGFVLVIASGLVIAALPSTALRGTPGGTPRGAPQTNPRSIHFVDDFERGLLDAWQMPYPEDWEILAEDGNRYLHMKRNREPGVPRRPLQFVLLKGVNVGTFDFRARVRRKGKSMIVVFNYVDTLHFYYAHLSADAGKQQPVHNGIFLVNNAPRVRIAGLDAPPALPDNSWHQVRVARNAASGRIEVWSDVESQPLFTVVDRTFACGQIGIGSFDETGDFDDVQLRSDDAGCSPGNVPPGSKDQGPAANRKKLGVIAMKVTGQEFLLGTAGGKTNIDLLLRYSLSLPVSAAVVGMPHLDFISHNAELVRNFSPLAPSELERLFRANAVSRIEPDYAEPQLCQRAPSALRGITVPRGRPAQNLTHLHHVSDFKISSRVHGEDGVAASCHHAISQALTGGSVKPRHALFQQHQL